MEAAGIIPPIVAKTTVSHAVSTAAVMTIGVITTVMTAVDPKGVLL